MININSFSGSPSEQSSKLNNSGFDYDWSVEYSETKTKTCLYK